MTYRIDYVPGKGCYPPTPIDHAELVELWLEGVKLADLAARYKCSTQAIHRRAMKIGLPPRARSTGTLPQRAIVRAYLEGQTANEIGDALGCSHSTILDVLRAQGVTIRRPVIRVPDLRSECIRLWRAGLNDSQIGARLGLSNQQVSRRIRSLVGPRQKGIKARVSIEKVVAMKRRGMSFSEIGREIGCHRSCIARRLERAARKESHAKAN